MTSKSGYSTRPSASRQPGSQRSPLWHRGGYDIEDWDFGSSTGEEVGVGAAGLAVLVRDPPAGAGGSGGSALQEQPNGRRPAPAEASSAAPGAANRDAFGAQRSSCGTCPCPTPYLSASLERGLNRRPYDIRLLSGARLKAGLVLP
jgi:hypothetical protein